MVKRLAFCVITGCITLSAFSQNRQGGDPKLTEYWAPEPKKVTAGKTQADPPSDAIVLFNGSDASQWTDASGGPMKWNVANGAITVVA